MPSAERDAFTESPEVDATGMPGATDILNLHPTAKASKVDAAVPAEIVEKADVIGGDIQDQIIAIEALPRIERSAA